jgi:hypothetical protein
MVGLTCRQRILSSRGKFRLEAFSDVEEHICILLTHQFVRFEVLADWWW